MTFLYKNHSYLFPLPLFLQVAWALLPLSCARRWRMWPCSARRRPANTRPSLRAESRIQSTIAPRTMWRKSARSVQKVKDIVWKRALKFEVFVCAGIGKIRGQPELACHKVQSKVRSRSKNLKSKLRKARESPKREIPKLKTKQEYRESNLDQGTDAGHTAWQQTNQKRLRGRHKLDLRTQGVIN